MAHTHFEFDILSNTPTHNDGRCHVFRISANASIWVLGTVFYDDPDVTYFIKRKCKTKKKHRDRANKNSILFRI